MLLRRYSVEGAYEQLKDLTRGAEVTSASLHLFINQLKVSEEVKSKLLSLTPRAYTGFASELVGKYDEFLLNSSQSAHSEASASHKSERQESVNSKSKYSK